MDRMYFTVSTQKRKFIEAELASHGYLDNPRCNYVREYAVAAADLLSYTKKQLAALIAAKVNNGPR